MTENATTLSFTGQPLVEVFDTPAAAEFFVHSLTRMSRSSAHSPLPLWASFTVAEDEERYVCLVYSPQVLGRVLDKTNVEDYTMAFFHFLENPPYDWVWADVREGKMGGLVDNFGQFHPDYCSVGIAELFSQWESHKQKADLLGQVCVDAPVRAKPKM